MTSVRLSLPIRYNGLPRFPNRRSRSACRPDAIDPSSSLLKKQARITSKGQITVPHAVRRAMGVRPGNKLLFEQDGSEFRVKPVQTESPFDKYRGIGNPGIPSGRKAINRYIRRLRGR